ncbi:ATP-binding cassette domain-containing protein [bacterium]|nr:ATP-binding cassette domain-containing protein [bacterium]
MNTILTVSHLTKYYEQRLIINDLSFSIGKGDRVTFFAPSGSGKTTLIAILNGFDADYQGQYSLSAKSLVTIFQEPRLFAHMTVKENILFPLQVKGKRLTTDFQQRLDHWMEVCEISDKLEQYPYQLSGGSKQKVALVRGLLDFPDFVMMDEPFKSIDIVSKTAIIRHIVEVYPEMTILLVTHNLEEIPLLSKSLMVFKRKISSDFAFYPDISNSHLSSFIPQVIEDLL